VRVALPRLGLLLPVLAGPMTGEERVPCLQQLALPLPDRRGMHAVLTGQGVDRLEPLRGFQGQLNRALGPVSGAWL
jgi:hypothetical protein